MRLATLSLVLLAGACFEDRDPLTSASQGGTPSGMTWGGTTTGGSVASGETAATGTTAASGGTADTGPGSSAGTTEVGSSGAMTTGPVGACGDLACGPGEDCGNCPGDCGACPPACGNMSCESGEDCGNCPGDCGACPPSCPNGACDAGEGCDTCPADCGACPLGFPPGGPPDGNCIGPEGSGGPNCGNIADAWTKAAVNVGFYPFKVKAGVQTHLYTCDNRTIEDLGPGQGFAAQSTRNPGCADNPPLRPALSGFVFGYARGSARSGWIPADALEFTGYAGGSCADGPASADFQVAHNPYDGCKPMTCDDPNKQSCVGTNTPPADDPNHTKSDCGGAGIDQLREIVAADLYLRYAPISTAIRYLHKGDRFHVLYDNKKGWVFGEVTLSTCPALTPVGARGWVENNPAYFKVL